MTRISVELTPDEIRLLISLASDQLFRREFIDPKMPGYKQKAGEIEMAKALVERLRGLTQEPGESQRGQRRAV